MTKNHPEISCCCPRNIDQQCLLQEQTCPTEVHPLSQSCRAGRVKVCKINGDRKICARMANMGVIPGTEMELICPKQGRQYMIKVHGGTISLDSLTADNIYVTPL